MKIRTREQYRERMARRSQRTTATTDPTPGVSTHATPLDWDQRADRYLVQSGRFTPAQSRRLWSKERRALART